jgi:hypothetical protein
MYFHEIKCQKCGAMAKVCKLSNAEVDAANTNSIKVDCQIQCPNCGVVNQTDTIVRGEGIIPPTHK